jgi:hypothetical protein
MKHKDRLTKVLEEDQYLSGHIGNGKLHNGLLYYVLSNVQAPETCVCLGSGAGSVPAFMREGQIASLPSDEASTAKTFLVDADALTEGGGDWGSTVVHDEDSSFRLQYKDIEVLKMSTDDSCEYFANKKILIDYLHIDADHSYAQSFKDFENFYRTYSLMSPDFIITMHDTAINFLDGGDGGVGRAIANIRQKYTELEVMDFNAPCETPGPIWDGKFDGKYKAGTCIIKPKIPNKFEDHDSGEFFK